MLAANRHRPSHATIVAYLALFVALGGGAVAATGLVGSSGKIRGCVGAGGKLRLLRSGQHCKHRETAIAWNQAGEPGPRGERGPAATNAEHAVSADSATRAGSAGSADHATSADSAGDADKLDGKDSSVFAPVGSEAFQAAPLNNGGGTLCHWLPYGNGFSAPRFFRDPAGVVHLTGLAYAVGGAAGGTHCGTHLPGDYQIMTLPEGYRPDAVLALSTVSNNTPGRINIHPGGLVGIEPDYPTWANATQWVSLDVSFRCAPAGQSGCP